MSFLKKKKIERIQRNWKITKDCLDLIMECARSNHPREFGGLLRADSDLKDTIIEIVILPGTISGDSHAIFKLHMMPIDFSVVGTVHSHPSYSFEPSDADLHLFQKYGKIHIIVAKPYNNDSWQAYDYNGMEVPMGII